MNSPEDLTAWLGAAQEAARRGAAVLEDWRRRFTVREKARFDLVTEADLASQRAIQDFLHQQFPDHAFLGEEDKVGWVESSEPTSKTVGSEDFTHPTGREPDAPPTWIVDPL